MIYITSICADLRFQLKVNLNLFGVEGYLAGAQYDIELYLQKHLHMSITSDKTEVYMFGLLTDLRITFEWVSQLTICQRPVLISHTDHMLIL